ncbi:diacylglycerol/lipid kinase family protein [Wenjunlia tyrosinilytica]|uniref:Phosphoesterase n=1 Tax=Wenjunlia tyrosinilytica TaxID=1544741 RepID=A0A918E127_9ACTN|nr:phosphatase PAP2 family protein [Wenjunlia tyrosinilytica]GGO95031.1 phosphoesterase [Wenjunlia tyrosinilytica]
MRRRIGDLDQRLFARVAASRLRGAHPLLPKLSRAADHGLLWFGTAAVLGASGGRAARRAALRGVGALAIASAITNTLAKPSTRRTRPVIDSVPIVRRLTRQPITTSFPSGHSASAAAFAAGVALEAPRYALAVVPVAAAVAASRVYVGVHYPGDVLAGAAIGVAAAALTSRWWPVKPETPAAAVRPRRPAPALGEGKGLSIVVNSGAGLPIGPNAAAVAADRLRTLLPSAEVVERGPDDDLLALLDEAAREAAGRDGALGVCGGDGSVNAAAEAAARHHVPLAVFPGGTFNHFAMDLGVETLEDCARAVRDGDAVTVDMAIVQSPGTGEVRPFLNTFSIGVYPELVRARERWEGAIGKWPAVAIGLARVLARARPRTVRINGRERRLWLLFAGNCVYQPPGFAPTYRTRLDDGLLDIRAVDGSAPLARTRLLFAALTGTLGSSRVLVAVQLRRLRLDGLEGVEHYAFDGEVAPADGSLVLDKRRSALTVYRPAVPNPLLDGD